MRESDLRNGSFCDNVPTDDEDLQFPLVRVGPGGKFKAVILSTCLLCRRTHWWNGRTCPCWGDGCAACAVNTEARWHAYLAVIDQHSAKIQIIELTAKAVKPVRDWIDDFGSCRGALLELNRVTKKPNGRLFASLSRGPIAVELLPPSPDVERLLNKCWGVDHAPSIAAALAERLRVHPVNGVA